jgi:hypothetical protein
MKDAPGGVGDSGEGSECACSMKTIDYYFQEKKSHNAIFSPIESKKGVQVSRIWHVAVDNVFEAAVLVVEHDCGGSVGVWQCGSMSGTGTDTGTGEWRGGGIGGGVRSI